MKVFISHQRVDSDIAGTIAARLQVYHDIDSYLDIIDPVASKSGDQLGEYIRKQMSLCSQLMAVVSVATKESWWVPWEIGVATEKDYPICTFARDNTQLPEYLKKWPYLRSQQDIDEYARVSKQSEDSFRLHKSLKTEAAARRTSTENFHSTLRSRLGQL